MAPRLSVVFRQLARLGSFPECCRQANVTPISKGPPSSSVANYLPISITSVLSKVIECPLSVRLGRFVESSGVLPTTQLAYRKCLGTCDALFCVFHTHDSDCQVVSGTDCSVNSASSSLTWLQVFSAVQCKVIALPAFYDAITVWTDWVHHLSRQIRING